MKKNNILVIGSTNVDFLIQSERLPAFGETVTDGLFMQNFGGKGANQAVGAARAGGSVSFVTCLGTDLFADELFRRFTAEGIDTRFVFRDPTAATGSALIMLDREGNNYLSVAPGANYRLSPTHIDQALKELNEADMIILQMEIPCETTQHIFRLAAKCGKKIMFNLAPARTFDFSLLPETYALVVNEVEASMVTGMKVETDDEIRSAAGKLLVMGPGLAIITLGARGSYIASPDYRQFIPAYPVHAIDTTAAGDVYCGSLAMALVEGKSLPDAVLFAGAASAISVTRMGAQQSAPFRHEIDAFMLKAER